MPKKADAAPKLSTVQTTGSKQKVAEVSNKRLEKSKKKLKSKKLKSLASGEGSMCQINHSPHKY